MLVKSHQIACAHRGQRSPGGRGACILLPTCLPAPRAGRRRSMGGQPWRPRLVGAAFTGPALASLSWPGLGQCALAVTPAPPPSLASRTAPVRRRTFGAAPHAACMPRQHPHACPLLVAPLKQQQRARLHALSDQVDWIAPLPAMAGSVHRNALEQGLPLMGMSSWQRVVTRRMHHGGQVGGRWVAGKSNNLHAWHTCPAGMPAHCCCSRLCCR